MMQRLFTWSECLLSCCTLQVYKILNPWRCRRLRSSDLLPSEIYTIWTDLWLYKSHRDHTGHSEVLGPCGLMVKALVFGPQIENH